MLIYKIDQFLDGQVALLAADFGEKLRERQGLLEMLLNDGAQHHGIQGFQTQFREEKRSRTHRSRVIPVAAKLLQSCEHVFLDFLVSRLHTLISVDNSRHKPLKILGLLAAPPGPAQRNEIRALLRVSCNTIACQVLQVPQVNPPNSFRPCCAQSEITSPAGRSHNAPSE